MGGSWFTENFNDFSDEFFDVLGDVKYCDNVLEDIDPCDGEEDWEAKFQSIETPLDMFPTITSPSVIHFSQNDPYVTQISDDSPLSTKWPIPLPDVSGPKYVHTSRTFSPVSVLDNSTTSTLFEKLISDLPRNIVPLKRPRTKRSYNRRRVFSSIFFPARLARISRDESDSACTDTKVRIRRSSDPDAGEIRRCSHCQVSKTPQWREGPMGPKTLCNACGVRYRSGRLYPEYRPAASPTFVPSQHSNSHRKVLEMRKKVAPLAETSAACFADSFFP